MTVGPPAPLRIADASALLRCGFSAESLEAARAHIASIREGLRSDLDQCGSQPLATMPHANRVIERPQRALADYRANRRASEVSRILAAAGRLREAVDRVVIVAGGGAMAGIRALAQSCTHPYHNELSRGARGARPRIYFAGDDLDNDTLHGLLELLEQGDQPVRPEDAWGLIAVHAGEDDCESLAVLQLLLSRLRAACAGNEQQAADRLLVVSPPGSRFEAVALPCHQSFALEEGLQGPWSLFTAAALLPAAVLGIDVVRFLVGGTASTTSFCEGNADPAIELASLRHLLATRGARRRTLATSLLALQGFRSWHDERLAATIAAPILAARCGDLSVQKLVVTAPRGRCDAVSVDAKPTRERIHAHEASIDLELPGLDEAALGELAQTLLLATVVENQLSGFNSEL